MALKSEGSLIRKRVQSGERWQTRREPLPGCRLWSILVKGGLQSQTGLGLNPGLANH